MKTSFPRRRWVASALLFGLLFGCSSERYYYQPLTSDARTGRHSSEAFYLVPPEAPKGSIRIRSLGLADLKPKHGGKKVIALHLRESISNGDQVAWGWNAQEQTVAYPNDGTVAPIFANSDAATLPSIDIEPGQLRSVDLYFPLPEGATEPGEVPEFDFHWKISAGKELVAETTPFTRKAVPETVAMGGPYDPYGFGLGWGPWWWGPGPVVVAPGPFVHIRR